MVSRVLNFGYIISNRRMKYCPSFTVYQKYFKIRKYKTIYKSNNIKKGFIGVKALESAFFSNVLIEKIHLFLKRKIKKKGKMFFRIIPHIGITKKPLEVRMGKGKGPHTQWVYHIKKGQIFLEILILDYFLLKRVKRGLIMKLPLKIKFNKNI